MQLKTKRILLVVGMLVGAIVVLAILVMSAQEPPKMPVETPDMLVETLELSRSAENFEVRSQGTVRPRTQTELSAEVSGAIVEISPKFVAGGVFERNEVLLRIDPTDYAAAVSQAEALLAQRKIEYEGALKLREQGYRAEAEVASAAAALATAEADLVRSQRNLERTYIRLPYEGMVFSKDSDLGQYVNPGTKLGTTFATDYAEVRLPLTDQDLAFVQIPDSKEVTDSGGANGPIVTLSAVQKGRLEQWEAQIVRSEGVVDERSRVTYAVARVIDPYQLHAAGTPLPIGTFVAATIDGVDAQDLIRLPRSVLRGSDEVLVVTEDETIEIRNVNVLRTDANYAYLQSGVNEGERISLTPIAAPTNGMKVRTSEENPATALDVADADGTSAVTTSEDD